MIIKKIWLAGIILAFGIHEAQAFSCGRVIRAMFNPSAWSIFEDLSEDQIRSVFEAAKKSGNQELGGLALSHLLIRQKDLLFLSKNKVKALKNLRDILEKSFSYGPIRGVGSSAVQVGRELAWAIGPFLIRPLMGPKAKRLSQSLFELGALFEGETGDLRLKVLGIERDNFFNLLQEVYFKDRSGIEASFKAVKRFALLRSFALSVLLTFTGLHPADYFLPKDASKLMAAQLSNQIPLQSSLFLDQIQDDFRIFTRDKKVITFVERDFIRDAVPESPSKKFLELDDPAKGILELKILKKKLPNMEIKTFESAEKLNQLLVETHQEFDVVILVLHGLGTQRADGITSPDEGEMVIGRKRLSESIEKFTPGVLKDKSQLIFFSCFAGDKASKRIADSKENWVVLTKRLAGSKDVVSFAPANSISFNSDVRENLSPQEKLELIQLNRENQKEKFEEIKNVFSESTNFSIGVPKEEIDRIAQEFERKVEKLALVSAHIFQKGAGLYQASSILIHSMASNLPEFSSEVGFRSFDTRTGNTAFYNVEEPSLGRSVIIFRVTETSNTRSDMAKPLE